MQNIIKLSNIRNICQHLNQLDPMRTIIFIDLDNTLLRTQDLVFSVEWMKWQESLIMGDNWPDPNRLFNNHYDLHSKYRNWITLHDPLTILLEYDMKEILTRYVARGFKFVILTARDKSIAQVSIHQVESHYGTGLFWTDKLFFETDTTIFKNGIYFMSSKMKGDYINKLLTIFREIFAFDPTNLVFIDDTITECISVAMKHQNSSIQTFIFHYTYPDKYKQEFDDIDKKLYVIEWKKYINNIKKV